MDRISSIIVKQNEIIENLTALNTELITLLSQYIACEEYENRLENILRS